MSGWDDIGNFLGSIFKPIKGADDSYNAYGHWDSKQDPIPAMTMKGISNNPLQFGQSVGMHGSADITPVRHDTPTAPIPAPSNNVTSNSAATNADMSPQLGSSQEDPMLAMLRDAINNPNPYSSGPYMQNLDNARSASLKAIADARNSTQQNFDQSNDAISGIYAKGKADTLADNDVLKENNQNLQSGLNGMYGNAISTLQGDRTKEMTDRADMLNRLGIQASGIGDAGATQTQAIANASQQQQAASNKAISNGASDITANTARADGLISEGASRQAGLRSQLAGVLSQLTGKELDVNNQYAQNSMQAANQGYQDNLSRISALYGMKDKQQTFDQNAQKNILQSRLLSSMYSANAKGGGANGSMSNFDEADAALQAQGLNPADYDNALSDATLNYKDPTGGSQPSPSDTYLLQQMVKNSGGKLDANAVQRFLALRAKGNNNYSVPSAGGSAGNAQIAAMLGMGY